MQISNYYAKHKVFKIFFIIFISLLITNVFLCFIITTTAGGTRPSAPILKIPIDNDYLKNTTPRLEWYRSTDMESDPLKYDIWVDEFGGGWSTLVTNYTTGFSETHWNISSTLSDGAYQWRVRANDYQGLPNSTSLWSQVWKFTIDTEAPFNVNSSGDFNTYTGSPLTIYGNFSDNRSNISTSTIYYKRSYETIYRYQTMLESTFNKFYIKDQLLGITTSNDDDDYVYYLIAEDQAGNTFKYSKTGGFDFTITVLDNIPPEVTSGSGRINATTDDEFLIFINCKDNIELSSATLYIQKKSEQWKSIELNEYSLGRYIINYSELETYLDINTSDGINYNYYILSSDISNNILNYSKSPGVPWEIEVIDNDDPEIINGAGNLLVTTDDPFEIYANFNDNAKVTNAKIFIRKLAEPDNNWYSLYMNELIENSYSIGYNELKTHPQFKMNTAPGGDYEYYILAFDSANNYCNYTQAAEEPWRIRVLDNDLPIFTSGSGDFKITTDDPFVIYANFTDNSNVLAANIYIRRVLYNQPDEPLVINKGDWLKIRMEYNTPGVIGNFYISYDALKTDLGIDTTHGGALEYYVIANDFADNEYNYTRNNDDSWKITILDNDPPVQLAGPGNFSVKTNESFTISADFYDNIEVTSAILYYKPENLDDESQTGIWSKFNMHITDISSDNNDNENTFVIYKCSATNSDLGLILPEENSNYLYYIQVYDGCLNVFNYGTSSNPFKITLLDALPPLIESWSFEPINLTAAYDEDFIIKVIIKDLGGSGLDDKSVMIRYKRGNYDATYHDYTYMVPTFFYGGFTRENVWESRSDLASGWQFAIPRPLVNDFINDNKIRYNWEIISGENINFEIRCKDVEGNIFESGIRMEYVDPVPINHFPKIELVAPIQNENLSGTHHIYWIASDPDDDELMIDIYISNDNGENWNILATNVQNTGAYSWDTKEFENSEECLIKIIAKDSELSEYNVSNNEFTIYNKDRDSIDDSPGTDGFSSIANNRFLLISIGISIFAIISGIGFISSTEIGKFKILSLIFAPFYSKLHHDDVLDHFTRGQIYGYIKAKPGEHYNTIKASLGLNNGTLSHHLRVLEKEEFIYSQRDGFNARFYPRELKVTLKDSLKLNKFQEEILNKVRAQPGISQHEIVAQLGNSQQVISYNLTKLVRDEILRINKIGRLNTYYVNSPEVFVPETQDQIPSSYGSVQPQPVNLSYPTTVNQTQYPPQSYLPKEPQIQNPNITQPRLPPMNSQQINKNNLKRISQSQE